MGARRIRRVVIVVAVSVVAARGIAACGDDTVVASSDAGSDVARTPPPPMPTQAPPPPPPGAEGGNDSGSDATDAGDAACNGYVGNVCDNIGHHSGANDWSCVDAATCVDWCKAQNPGFALNGQFQCTSLAGDAQFECTCFQP